MARRWVKPLAIILAISLVDDFVRFGRLVIIKGLGLFGHCKPAQFFGFLVGLQLREARGTPCREPVAAVDTDSEYLDIPAFLRRQAD